MNLLDIIWNMVDIVWALRKVLAVGFILALAAFLYCAGTAEQVGEDYEEDISGTPPTKAPQTWGGAQV